MSDVDGSHCRCSSAALTLVEVLMVCALLGMVAMLGLGVVRNAGRVDPAVQVPASLQEWWATQRAKMQQLPTLTGSRPALAAVDSPVPAGTAGITSFPFRLKLNGDGARLLHADGTEISRWSAAPLRCRWFEGGVEHSAAHSNKHSGSSGNTVDVVMVDRAGRHRDVRLALWGELQRQQWYCYGLSGHWEPMP